MEENHIPELLHDALAAVLEAARPVMSFLNADQDRGVSLAEFACLAENLRLARTALHSVDGDRKAAAFSLLSEGSFRLALLELFAVLLRSRNEDSEVTLRCMRMVAGAAVECGMLLCDLLYTAEVKPSTSRDTRGVATFVEALLRSDSMQAYSRQLALCVSTARALLGQPPSQPAAADGPAAAAPNPSADAVLEAAELNTSLLRFMCALLRPIANTIQDLLLENWQGGTDVPDYELYGIMAEQLETSHVLDHMGQTFIFTAQLLDRATALAAGQEPPEGTAAEGAAAEAAARRSSCLAQLHTAMADFNTAYLDLMSSRLFGENAHTSQVATALSQCCVQHFVMSAGLVLLSLLDGEPCYGLPQQVVRSLKAVVLPSLEQRRAASLAVIAEQDGKATNALLRVLLQAMTTMPRGFNSWRPISWIFQRGAFAIAASSKIWAAFERLPLLQSGDGAGNPGIQLLPGSEAAGALAGLLAAAGQEGQQVPRLQVLLPQAVLSEMPNIICACFRLLQHAPRDSPEWLAAEVAIWQMVLAPLQQGHQGTGKEGLAADTFYHAWPLEQQGLPAEPPPQIRAALLADAMPCLETLLRTAAREPEGREAGVLSTLLKGLSDNAVSSRPYCLTWYMAYGDLGKAASFLCSMKKFLLSVELPLSAVMVAGLKRGGGAGTGQGAHRSAAADGATGAAGAMRNAGGGSSAATGGQSAAPKAAAPFLAWCCKFLREAHDIFVQSPQVGRQSAASQQLRRLLCAAVCDLLPPLARIVRRVANGLLAQGTGGSGASGASWREPRAWQAELAALDEGSTDIDRTHRVPEANMLNAAVVAMVSWLPTVASDLMAAPSLPRGGAGASTDRDEEDRRRHTAACAVAAAAAAADPVQSSARREGWRRFMLEEVEVVETVGACLQLMSHPLMRKYWQVIEWGRVSIGVSQALGAVMSACPQELVQKVQATALKATSASTSSGTNSSRAGPRAAGSRSAVAGSDDASSAEAVNLALWPPKPVRMLEVHLTDKGYPDESRKLKVLQQLLQGLHRGEEPRPPPCLQSGTWVDKAAGLAMLPPDAARRWLRPYTCGNPVCTNMEGDSEGLLALPDDCPGCGAVRYCCGECWEKHWLVGHQASCGRD